MHWRWISIAALLAALVAGYGAFVRRDPSLVSLSDSERAPSYFLRNAIITQTEQDGSPGLRLVAERIDQASAGASIRLTSVQVDFLRTQDRQWTLTAQEGFIPPQSRVIEFRGDVHLRPIDATTPTYLRTDELAVDTERQVAYTTTSPSKIQYGNLTATVQRFEADLNSERVKLESVRGRSERR
jgi:LPS export ABC transporter protein LptC